MSGEPVLLSDDRIGVRTLTLNRPHHKNAINREPWIALGDALTAAGTDHAVLALVTGAGGDFCSASRYLGVRRHPSAAAQACRPAAGQTAGAVGRDHRRRGSPGPQPGDLGGVRDALAIEARAQAVNFATADAAEACAAFAEKRDPTFTGKWAVSRSEHKDA